MKTSVSLSVFPAPPGMPALFSGGTEQNISRIQELGYDGVDLFVKDPASADTRRTLALLRQYGLGIGAVMPAALAGEGLYLGATEKNIREECVRRIGEIVHFAADAGAMVSIGLVRGSKTQGEAMEAFERRFVESCVQVLGISQPLGVPLLLEPINRYEINTILSVNEGLDFIRRSGLPIYLMNDLFHMNIEDADIERILLDSLPYTKHIHFLDSNRLPPGMGHLDMARYYRLLKNAGYAGYLCLEALPGRLDPDMCAVKGAEFFRQMTTCAAYHAVP